MQSNGYQYSYQSSYDWSVSTMFDYCFQRFSPVDKFRSALAVWNGRASSRHCRATLIVSVVHIRNNNNNSVIIYLMYSFSSSQALRQALVYWLQQMYRPVNWTSTCSKHFAHHFAFTRLYKNNVWKSVVYSFALQAWKWKTFKSAYNSMQVVFS